MLNVLKGDKDVMWFHYNCKAWEEAKKLREENKKIRQELKELRV